MKLGIMQPYFFPYLGYYDLINVTDHWIVFDTAQYIRHGWINRNRILHPSAGWQYIIAPVRKHGLATPISDVRVNDDIAWRQRILGQLARYRRAPHFHAVMDLVEKSLATTDNRLARINVKALHDTCDYLGIPFRYQYLSEMKLDLPPVQGPGDWALHIAEQLGAAEYVNPPGGRDLFDPAAFAHAGIRLTIRDLPAMTYSCPGFTFEAGLSILDVMMWNAPERVRDFLDQWRSGARPTTPSAG